jgi:hypothetical protein
MLLIIRKTWNISRRVLLLMKRGMSQVGIQETKTIITICGIGGMESEEQLHSQTSFMRRQMRKMRKQSMGKIQAVEMISLGRGTMQSILQRRKLRRIMCSMSREREMENLTEERNLTLKQGLSGTVQEMKSSLIISSSYLRK